MQLKISNQAHERLKTKEYPDVLSVHQVQQILGIGRISVYHLIESGKISAFCMGRVYKVPKQAIAKFLKNNQGVKSNDR